MIVSFSLILLCQLIGEVFVRGLRLPIPGPVIGLMLLLVLLFARDHFSLLARGPLGDGGVENASRGLLANLSGVGVVQKLDLLAEHGIAIVLILAISVVLTLLATVATFLVVSRLMARASEKP